MVILYSEHTDMLLPNGSLYSATPPGFGYKNYTKKQLVPICTWPTVRQEMELTGNNVQFPLNKSLF